MPEYASILHILVVITSSVYAESEQKMSEAAD